MHHMQPAVCAAASECPLLQGREWRGSTHDLAVASAALPLMMLLCCYYSILEREPAT